MKQVTKSKVVSNNFGPWANRAMLGQTNSTTKSVIESYWCLNLKDFYFSWGSQSKPSTIADFKGSAIISYVSGRREEWNPCHHSVVEFCCLPYAKIWSQATRARYYVAQFYRDPVNGMLTERLERHLTDDYRNARLRAWLTMQPRFEGEISLINFLWELKEVGELVSSAYNIMRKMKKLIRRRPKKPRDPTVDTSSAILTWNLAITPLLSDLITIWNQLFLKVREAQQAFANAGQEPQTSYYSEILADQSNLSPGYSNDYYHDYGTQYTTKFTAALMYGYTYNMRSYHDAFMKYWGLNGSWEALYNAFPFSFIVDYFVKLGDAIHYMERDKNVNTHIMRYSESLKTIKSNGTHLTSRSTYGYNYTILNGIENSTGLTTGYRSRLYTRLITSPLTTGFYVPKVNSTSDKQKLNLLCLARQAFR